VRAAARSLASSTRGDAVPPRTAPDPKAFYKVFQDPSHNDLWCICPVDALDGDLADTVHVDSDIEAIIVLAYLMRLRADLDGVRFLGDQADQERDLMVLRYWRSEVTPGWDEGNRHG